MRIAKEFWIFSESTVLNNLQSIAQENHYQLLDSPETDPAPYIWNYVGIERLQSTMNILRESDHVPAQVPPLPKAGGDKNVWRPKAVGDHNVCQHQMVTCGREAVHGSNLINKVSLFNHFR